LGPRHQSGAHDPGGPELPARTGDLAHQDVRVFEAVGDAVLRELAVAVDVDDVEPFDVARPVVVGAAAGRDEVFEVAELAEDRFRKEDVVGGVQAPVVETQPDVAKDGPRLI
jgi:hypothetical protein